MESDFEFLTHPFHHIIHKIKTISSIRCNTWLKKSKYSELLDPTDYLRNRFDYPSKNTNNLVFHLNRPKNKFMTIPSIQILHTKSYKIYQLSKPQEIPVWFLRMQSFLSRLTDNIFETIETKLFIKLIILKKIASVLHKIIYISLQIKWCYSDRP